MAKYLVLVILSIINISQIFSQVDSNKISIVSYWNKGDQYIYDCSMSKYKVIGQDSTTEMTITYQLDIIVTDSLPTYYIIDAKYSNHNVKTDVKEIEEIMNATPDITLTIETNDVGQVEDLKNWEEVQRYVAKPMNDLKDKYKDNQVANQTIEAMSVMFSSKDAIMSSSMQDIVSLQYFHGLEYKKDTIIEADQQRNSNFSNALLDVKVSIWCDSILYEDGVVKMVKFEEFNSEQLKQELYKYFKKVGVNFTQDDLKELNMELTISTVNYIDIATGWTVYSSEYKETITDNVISIEERKVIMR